MECLGTVEQCVSGGYANERALLLAFAQIYVPGSTRRVKKIMEELCGLGVNSTHATGGR